MSTAQVEYIANIVIGQAQALSDELAGIATLETVEIDSDGDQVVRLRTAQAGTLEQMLQHDGRVHGWIIEE